MMRIISIVLLLSVAPCSHAQTAAKLLAAPDIIPPATAEMQHPEFWISRIQNPDLVIMTPEQIAEFNRKNRSRSLSRKDIRGNTVLVDSVITGGATFTGISFHLSDPLSIREYPGDALKKQLSEVRDFIAKTALWDRRQIPLPESSKRELLADMNAERIPATIRPRYGVVVRHTLNRLVPTELKVYRGQFQWLDAFQNATLETGMPVAVLHTSKSGDWLCVKSEYSLGWVPAANIALGPANRIRTVSDPKNFIMTVVHKAPVYADRECETWLTDLYMGERLALDEKTGSAWRVTVPVRQPDDKLGTVRGWIKSDAGVNVGYQEYTQRNVITTFFRLLNRPYGWGGTDHERDCAGSIRSVYRTFGIFMPRWTVYELYHTDNVITFQANTPIGEKYRLLETCEPGITVCGFNWHVTLYLGKVARTHYIIHQNGYSYHDENGTEFRVGRVSVNHTEIEGGGDIRNWTELSVFK
ncbi:MAG: SH3 domain-containing protein [Candidatus Latescibacterota bacterium]